MYDLAGTMRRDMYYDSLAEERSEAQYLTWRKKLFQRETMIEIGNFMKEHRMGVATELCNPRAGAFNVCLQMKFLDGGSALIRFPKPGRSSFPEEKLRKEVAIMRYINEHTSIPVPFVLHSGMSGESPAKMGPFILMDYITHAGDMTDELNTPSLSDEDRPTLDPHISEDKLKFCYGQMADILLQVSQPSFAQIGSLEEREDGCWSVTSRPVTFNMNELVATANFPQSKLPSTVFQTSRSYFTALANTNLIHLSTQRNDAIDSAEDCRRKYVALHVFRKIISDGRFPRASEHSPKQFKLFCDDFRPTNVLVDSDGRIVGVIDWEFCYAAPAEFSYSPPWWLLIENPEKWPHGISDWARQYEPRLCTFLAALREREDVKINDGTLTEEQRLSVRMRASWENGDFWMCYAARNSWAFDVIFWERIVTNPRYFKDNAGYEELLEMLSQQERDDMEEFVRRKLEEKESRTLHDLEREEEESQVNGWI